MVKGFPGIRGGLSCFWGRLFGKSDRRGQPDPKLPPF